jgi:hypothetical protein
MHRVNIQEPDKLHRHDESATKWDNLTKEHQVTSTDRRQFTLAYTVNAL